MKKRSMSKNVVEKIESERQDFKSLLLENPNYFGTFPASKMKSVMPMKYNVKYEELRCVGFYPDGDRLEAVVDLKLPYGYGGTATGSIEYVRFFVDWDGDGDYSEPDENAGMLSFKAQDTPDWEADCVKNPAKPLSYAVTLPLSTKKRYCELPRLLKIKAILSWNTPPTNDPAFIPPWGNAIERWIQVKALKHKPVDLAKEEFVEMIEIGKKAPGLSAAKILTPAELKKIYGKEVPEHRYNFKELQHLAETVHKNPFLLHDLKGKYNSDLIKKISGMATLSEGDTRYEEMHCIGMDSDHDTLTAVLTVKQPVGYGGNLCTDGTTEYVGFWAYVHDDIEQMCYWKYLGTSAVNVHDIKDTSKHGGIQYAVYLPADLSCFRHGKVRALKIRGILSWQAKPPTNDPNYIPVWGNRKEAIVPLVHSPTVPGQHIPSIRHVGQMSTLYIAGNPDSLVSGAVDDGYADGQSITAFQANKSPFGGMVNIGGSISYPNVDPYSPSPMKYKVQYKRDSSALWQDITDAFWITVKENNDPPKAIHQEAPDGYFTYREYIQYTAPYSWYDVDGEVLAQWNTRQAVGGDGLYELRVLLKTPGAPADPALGIPADHISSAVVKIMVDNTVPSISLTLDQGGCSLFKIPSTITGKFSATDENIRRYVVSVLPPVASPPKFNVPPGSAPQHLQATLEGQYPSSSPLPAGVDLITSPGVTDLAFELDTEFVDPATGTTYAQQCGYVIYIDAWDRAIVDNHNEGNRNGTSVGLCLLKKS